MFDVIEHLPDPRAALQRCHSWLAAHGRLFITTPDTDSLAARLLGRHWYYVDLDEHIALFSGANLRALLEQSAFVVRGTRTVGRRYRFSYIEQRLRYLASGGAVMRLTHLAAQPLRLWPDAQVPLNFGDVIGIVAERA